MGLIGWRGTQSYHTYAHSFTLSYLFIYEYGTHWMTRHSIICGKMWTRDSSATHIRMWDSWLTYTWISDSWVTHIWIRDSVLTHCWLIIHSYMNEWLIHVWISDSWVTRIWMRDSLLTNCWLIIATHCNTLQNTATHCNTLQHTATHCNTLQHTATHCNTRIRMRDSFLTHCWLIIDSYMNEWLNHI